MYASSSKIEIQGTQISLQVVWMDQEDGDDRISDKIEQLFESYNRRIAPTRVLFVCPLGIETCIKLHFESFLASGEGRLKSISHISVAPFDRKAKILAEGVIPLVVPAGEDQWVISDAELHKYAKDAVVDIFDSTPTILEAPHGYLFRKPSGQEEQYFVRAGNLLRDPSSLPVFNYLLLRVLPPACSIIYIDSFTILSFALGLRSLLRHFNPAASAIPLPEIENMHSYNISSEFRIPNERNYFILISASTSGGFARKLVSEKEAIRERIIHLLGVGPEDEMLRESSIYFRPRALSPPLGLDRKGVIEIGTEEFLVAQGLPRSVRISRAHVHKEAARELKREFYADALKFYEPRANPQSGHSTFSVVMSPKERPQCPLKEWVSESLIHQIPASTGMILYMDDDLSAWVSCLLSEALGGTLKVQPAKEIQTLSLPDSIVVVAFQDDDLEGFGRANVMLRSVCPIHCHYVVCYAFPSSARGYERLKDDLQQGRGEMAGWSEYFVLPIGHRDLHESLAADGEGFSIEDVEKHGKILGDALSGALRARHEQSSRPRDGLFLPRVDGQPLKLRRDSIFFGRGDAPRSQIAAYAMLSNAMQAARERDISGGGDIGLVFDENPFVRAVLDPSMFARYSDGVLQASLLRAARPAELDYSANDDLSGQFAATCLSVFYGAGNEVGDAALEFVYALARGKVSLRQSDRDRLCKEIKSDAIMRAVYELFA